MLVQRQDHCWFGLDRESDVVRSPVSTESAAQYQIQTFPACATLHALTFLCTPTKYDMLHELQKWALEFQEIAAATSAAPSGCIPEKFKDDSRPGSRVC